MSKINRLTQEHPEFSVNLIDLIRKLDPSTTGKFMPFLINQVKSDLKNQPQRIDNDTHNLVKKILPNGNEVEKFLIVMLFNSLGYENLYNLYEFDKHLTDNRINETDISKYKTWDDINLNLLNAELKLKESEFRKQIDVLYDENGWLILKPLSYEASLAYGAGTKWCTASKTNSSYFYDYCTEGILIYIINRKIGTKIAMYGSISSTMFNPKVEISFWNAEDVKTDSMELNLPTEIMGVLRGQINDKTKLKPNKYFFSENILNKINSRSKIGNNRVDRGGIPMEEVVRPAIDYATEIEHDLDAMRRIDEDLICKTRILAPGVQMLDAEEIFLPEEWLTINEIDDVLALLNGPLPKMPGFEIYYRAYPNGRVILVTDRIENEIVQSRIIRDVRNGRDEIESNINPFSYFVNNRELLFNEAEPEWVRDREGYILGDEQPTEQLVYKDYDEDVLD